MPGMTGHEQRPCAIMPCYCEYLLQQKTLCCYCMTSGLSLVYGGYSLLFQLKQKRIELHLCKAIPGQPVHKQLWI